MACHRSSAVHALVGPGESSTGVPSATIDYDRRAVPECPDLTVVAEALDAALRGRPIASAAAPGPLAVRGTPDELSGLVGQRVERHPTARQVPADRPRPRPRRRQPDADRPVPAGRRRDGQAPIEDRRRPGLRTATRWGPGQASVRRLDPRCGLVAGRRGPAGGPLPGPDPDGQGLSAAGRRRSAPFPGWAPTRSGRTSTTRRSPSRSGATGSAAIRAS